MGEHPVRGSVRGAGPPQRHGDKRTCPCLALPVIRGPSAGLPKATHDSPGGGWFFLS